MDAATLYVIMTLQGKPQVSIDRYDSLEICEEQLKRYAAYKNDQLVWCVRERDTWTRMAPIDANAAGRSTRPAE